MKLFRLLKETFKEFLQDNPFLYSSSIAFYTVFSLPPIFVLASRTIQSIFSTDKVQTELYNRVRELVGEQGAEFLQMELSYNLPGDQQGIYTVTVSIITLIFGATAVFVALQNAINFIWRIKPKPKNDILKFLWNRVLSFATLLGVTFIILISLILDTAMVLLSDAITQYFSLVGRYLIIAVNALLSMTTTTLIFALFFQVLPDAEVKWKHVWRGAFGTALLFFLGKYLIGIYLGNSSFSSLYGKAGALVVILIWVYYSTLILLLGAEFTYVYAKSSGATIKPVDTAVEVEVKEVEKEEGG